MPFPFILCGLSSLYILFYKLNRGKNILVFIGVLAICISYLTKNIYLAEYLALNIVSAIGLTCIVLHCLFITKLDYKIFFYSSITTLLYVIFVKLNFDYNLILSTIPLCIIFALVLICNNKFNVGLGAVSLSYILIQLSNCYLLKGNQLYFVLFDSVVLGDVITLCFSVFVFKLLLNALTKFIINIRQKAKLNN